MIARILVLVALVFLAGCDTLVLSRPFEVDERWLRPCESHVQLNGNPTPKAVLEAYSQSTGADEWCRASREDIIRSYRDYRKRVKAS